MVTQKRSFIKFLFLSTYFIFSLQCFTAQADEQVGKLAVVNGDVRIAKNQNDPGRVAKPGDVLLNTEIVKTGANSGAKILFTDQSVIDLGPAAAFQVSDYSLNAGEDRTGTFSLLYGKVRALITKKVGPQGKVEFKSGTAVMGVRGTEFMVDNTAGGSPGRAGETAIVVMSGQIEVTPPGGGPPVSIGAGQMATSPPPTTSASTTSGTTTTSGGTTSSGSSSGGGIKVSTVSGDQMKSMLGTVKAEDQTFMGSVTISTKSEPGKSDSPSMAMSAVAGILKSGDVQLPPPASDSGSLKQAPPDLFSGTNSFLPPVSIVPGNIVHLSVSVQ